MTKTLPAIAIALLLGWSSVADANPDKQRRDRHNDRYQGQADHRTRVAQRPVGNANKRNKRQKVRKRIRAMRAWRLTEALDLNEQTAAKLFPILNQYDERFLKLARTGAATRKQLNQALEAPRPTPQTLNKLIDRLEAQQRAFYELQRDRFRAVRKVLTPTQAAHIVVLLPELDRKIRREIRRAMRGEGAGPRPERRRNRGAKHPSRFD